VLAEFFRALTTHKEVKTAYQNWQQGAVLINDMRSGFSYSGITFEEYRGQASFVQADGTLGRAASSPPGKPMPSRSARWTPSQPTSRQRLQRDGEHPRPAAVRQAGAAQVRPGHRSAHAIEPAADVPPPGRADQARCLPDGCRDVVRGGPQCRTADAVTVAGVTVHCAFRAPDETVLDGFALSRDYQIDYPAAWLTLAAGDTVEVAGNTYQVRDVRAIGDGTERRASLSQL
jgi:hypothetical protein